MNGFNFCLPWVWWQPARPSILTFAARSLPQGRWVCQTAGLRGQPWLRLKLRCPSRQWILSLDVPQPPCSPPLWADAILIPLASQEAVCEVTEVNENPGFLKWWRKSLHIHNPADLSHDPLHNQVTTAVSQRKFKYFRAFWLHLCVCVCCCCYYYCYFSITKLKDWPKKKRQWPFQSTKKKKNPTTTKHPRMCVECLFVYSLSRAAHAYRESSP